MDPVDPHPACTKRKSAPIEQDICIICQKLRGGTLEAKRSTGIAGLKSAAQSRKKLNDVKNRDVIDHIDNLDCDDPHVRCHRKCYSEFTNKTNINRLKKAIACTPSCDSSDVNDCSSTGRSNMPEPRYMSRSIVAPVDWSLCIFCQVKNARHELFPITTFQVSRNILDSAVLDHQMRTRLAGVSCLIASEGKYHNICRSAFNRKTEKNKQNVKHTDLPMIFLCEELKYASEKNQIIKLSDVWDRYCVLADETSTTVPQSFISRRASFREKLHPKVGSFFQFIQPLHRDKMERETLLVPSNYCHNIISDTYYNEQAEQSATTDMLTMPNYQPDDDIFLSLLHVAVKVRGDLSAHKGHNGFNISEEDAIACIPDSLYMFLNLLYGGTELLDGNFEDDSQCDRQMQVLNVAQDIVYGVSGGKKWTPKHIGLGSTLHQMTRSKKLVNIFHKAGHIVAYDDILRIDTALAEKTLNTMDPDTGFFMPPNLSDRFTHFTADNIDINDSTLDGKNTFHATQVAAWQRGHSSNLDLKDLKPSKQTTLKVPEVMESITPANIVEGLSMPAFTQEVNLQIFQSTKQNSIPAQTAESTDMAFHIRRQASGTNSLPSWTAFNQAISKVNPEQTTVGYMPIIQAPAHDIDTLNTVVQKCMYISDQLGQYYTVITVDQALFFKLMDLKWTNPAYKERLIPRLGGLHIAMNYCKVIGDHMKSSGLAEIWVESGILGPVSTERAMAGKDYNKAMRAHKLTSQALWQILLPQLLPYIQEQAPACYDDIVRLSQKKDDVEQLIDVLKEERFRDIVSEFAVSRNNPNFTFWWHYLEMVSILLMFTRAQRDGIWDLYLYSFRCMLPYFMRYDHTNYARWGSVYLADAHQLPDAVRTEFQQGNFVVKGSLSTFNQVDPDQSQEWLNCTGKKGGGIVGITKTPSALSRWALSFNLRSQIAADTREMFKASYDDSLVHKETSQGRQLIDTQAEQAILATLQRFDVFSPDTLSDMLQNAANKDLATDTIKDSLLNAVQLGQAQLENFVKKCISTHENVQAKPQFRDPIKKNNAATFASLYEVTRQTKSQKEIILKADRSVLHRLVTAYEAGREVNMEEIMKHELMPVPVAIVEMNKSLRSGNKSMLADVLTTGIDCSTTMVLEGRSSLLIDGQALVIAIGKPTGAHDFGELADNFVNAVLQKGRRYSRIDILFDRYRPISIKSTTRQRRSRNSQPVRRIIQDRTVPIPQNWQSFIALAENKADLAHFLSGELIAQAPADKIVVVSGGFADENHVESSSPALDVMNLQATHEEADTRLVLHAIHCSSNSNADNIVVCARDTDVLILLLAHLSEINCNVWMMAGTTKKPRFIPVNEVHRKLPEGSAQCILQFHALTGCDTTSYIAGHSKKTAYKTFTEYFPLLEPLGQGQLTTNGFKGAETFMCRLYNQSVDSVDKARLNMFPKANGPEMLPPTSDALKYHVMRVHYQTMVWRQANVPIPRLPEPQNMGWSLENGVLSPILMSLHPIPEACLEMVTCQCKSGCKSFRCKCRKSKLPCTGLCGCDRFSETCPCINYIA